MSAFLRAALGRGRLGRGAFWLRMAALWIVFAALAGPLADSRLGALLVSAAMLWALAATCVRRLHDRDLAGGWLLVALVPILGALWLAWQLAARRGVRGPTRWGEDPLHRPTDFLVVR